MAYSKRFVHDLIYGWGKTRRFTQDSPVRPDVWQEFGCFPGRPVELLLEPHIHSQPGKVFDKLATLIAEDKADVHRIRPAYNQAVVVGSFTLVEMIGLILPMTLWWDQLTADRAGWNWEEIDRDFDDVFSRHDGRHFSSAFAFAQVTGLLLAAEFAADLADELDGLYAAAPSGEAFVQLNKRKIAGAVAAGWARSGLEAFRPPQGNYVWSVSRNRPALLSVRKSGKAIKADAARRVFDIKCDGITWAVVDSGIDATHPAFRLPPATDGDPPGSRVVATYDFTNVRQLLFDPANKAALTAIQRETKDFARQAKDIHGWVKRGREINWEILEGVLAADHDPKKYKAPDDGHGTHVAGILGADWEPGEENNGKRIEGVCPDIRLIDIRVCGADGTSDEFTLLSALQFVRYLNSSRDAMAVHGVNLSISLHHDVRHFACGRTPICQEVERLVASGVVAVAAAGNQGFSSRHDGDGEPIENYSDISITDPGNAQAAITVGATHRTEPHTYGVSYFSSRGPTGDGRMKPDIVAPGEKIKAPVPGGGIAYMDGTSMAAPHVSGAAALLMARHRELIGRPQAIKDILCRTATDLGRERYFQGCGLVDVLRALQSV